MEREMTLIGVFIVYGFLIQATFAASLPQCAVGSPVGCLCRKTVDRSEPVCVSTVGASAVRLEEDRLGGFRAVYGREQAEVTLCSLGKTGFVGGTPSCAYAVGFCDPSARPTQRCCLKANCETCDDFRECSASRSTFGTTPTKQFVDYTPNPSPGFAAPSTVGVSSFPTFTPKPTPFWFTTKPTPISSNNNTPPPSPSTKTSLTTKTTTTTTTTTTKTKTEKTVSLTTNSKTLDPFQMVQFTSKLDEKSPQSNNNENGLIYGLIGGIIGLVCIFLAVLLLLKFFKVEIFSFFLSFNLS